MSRRPDRRATYDDLCRLPENMVGEILDGELIASPRPGPLHALTATAIGGALFGPFNRRPGGPGAPGGWWILDEPELHLHGDIVVPDIAGWRLDRLPALPATPAFELAPDWACEVISPSTMRFDRSRKMSIYAREKVGHLWLVDPLARTLEIFRLEGERWTVVVVWGGDEDRVRAEPFEDIELELSRWWPPDAADAG
jgi:Uma2 family endonuclease